MSTTELEVLQSILFNLRVFLFIVSLGVGAILSWIFLISLRVGVLVNRRVK